MRIDYAVAGPLTTLGTVEALGHLDGTDAPVDVCWPVHDLVIQPSDALALGVPGARLPSRVRCGFATYFQPSQALDHWIVEHLEPAGRWVRLDPEVLAKDLVEHPEDLAPGAFISGAEAWQAYRRGDIDATTFGVYGSENFGPGEIRGNLVKDLAALNKVEMLPWDERGRMTDPDLCVPQHLVL